MDFGDDEPTITTTELAELPEQEWTGNEFVGPVAALVLFALFVVTALCLWRWNRKRNLIYPQEKLQPAPQPQQTEYFRKIRVDEFCEILPSLLKDSGFELLKEFEDLDRHSPRARGQENLAAVEEGNVGRNRYIDIVPFNENRVILAGNRYINASYIHGYNQQNEYIAAQGPLGEEEEEILGRSSTVSDFYHMIVQKNVECIVMLTQCVELSKTKCSQYWPSSTDTVVNAEPFTISLKIQTFHRTYCYRELEVSSTDPTIPVRRVIHFQYLNWMDKKATDPKELLDFIRVVRATVLSNSPVVVHCSAGVGRSGVFIALDVLSQHVREHNYVNIGNFVYSLRQQRVLMVQTESQYRMIYLAVGIAIKEMMASLDKEANTKGLPIINGHSTAAQQQIQRY